MAGAIVNYTGSIGGAGTGYVVGDTVSVNNGSGGILTILALIPATSSVALSGLTAAGNGYAVSNNVDTNAITGVGSGFQIDIVEVSSGGGGSGYVHRIFTRLNTILDWLILPPKARGLRERGGFLRRSRTFSLLRS